MIVTQENWANYQDKIGNKANNLFKLMRIGLNVPQFVVISSDSLTDIFKSDKDLLSEKLKTLKNEIAQKLKSRYFAVRSSAFLEDSTNKSLAGQFMTKLDVTLEGIPQALEQVWNQADQYLNCAENQFAIIVQEFIEPQLAGITFTRNPIGSREMVIEYTKGRGELIVSGKVKPKSIKLNWESSVIDILPGLGKVIEDFKKVEAVFGHPQDIEWCYANSKWYFLQTRSITTIDQNCFEGIKYLENNLSRGEFYLVKNEITEIAPRPSKFTQDILEILYGENGPIQKVYQKYKIQYLPKNIFKIIGNELYLDKNKEIKTLLPSFIYKKQRPVFNSLGKLGTSLANVFRINRIIPADNVLIFNKLEEEYESIWENDFETAIKKFSEDYELVFEINLMAGLYLNKLKTVLDGQKIKITDILGENPFDIELPKLTKKEEMLGNSLEIGDESAFVGKTSINYAFADFKPKWEKIPAWQKSALETLINKTIIFERLRELGRWLIVKNNSKIREILFIKAAENGFENKTNIYFAGINEIKSGSLTENNLNQIKEDYHKFDRFEFPNIISSDIVESFEKIEMVSSGSAEGILVDKFVEGQKDQIIYTKNLVPTLAKYFKKINGIIAENGSLLSHLAIVARENRIPVMINVDIHKLKLKIGDKVNMDGKKVEIKKVG